MKWLIFYLFPLSILGLLMASHQESNTYMEEICDNAIDDDLDGLIDLNDPDCDCPLYEPRSLIPNPSFEELDCCPNTRSKLDCATGWTQASLATTDLLHTCDWMGWSGLEPPLPFPDGEGVAGFRNGRFSGEDAQPNWKEYMGACLLAPLKARNVYRIDFYIGYINENNSPTTQLVFFGAAKCDSLPFGINNPNHGCPTNGGGKGWVALDSVEIGGEEGWELKSVRLNPREDVNAIAIGPSCPPFYTDYETYYFLDKLVLADEIEFEYKISASGAPCGDDYTLSVPPIFSTDYQWYKNGIALVGETDNELNVRYGEGDYVVRINGNSSCQVTPPFVFRYPSTFEYPNVTICDNESYLLGDRELTEAGVYTEVLTGSNGCDSTVVLNLTVQGVAADTVKSSIFEGETYQLGDLSIDQPGEYEATFQSIDGCDSTVFLQLNFLEVYAPNAFSPNNDGINDFFNIQGGSELDRILRLEVFDRWGNLIYQGTDLAPSPNEGWNGRVNGALAGPGVYVFNASLLLSDGSEKKLNGSILLIR
jgi:gliding motility-associated-like protein